jgi:hypothetical protein
MCCVLRNIVYPGGAGAVIDENKALAEWLLVRKPRRNSEKSVFHCHPRHHESHMNSSQIISDLLGEKPESKSFTLNNQYHIRMADHSGRAV